MPVWHERSQIAREESGLVVIGLVQEQHADRAELYAAWKEFDFPILWDPFNTTETKTVPRAILIDSHGIVRKVGARPVEMLRFMSETFEAPTELPQVKTPDALFLPVRKGKTLTVHEEKARVAMSQLLWPKQHEVLSDQEPTVSLIGLAAARPEDGRAQFRAGVALRMRFDRDGGLGSLHQSDGAIDTKPVDRAADFQSALDYWSAALALDPNQYIWRRRIQQYGPRLDKPYPFYTWIEQAEADLSKRGVRLRRQVAELTPAELMLPKRDSASSEAALEPDPDGRILRSEGLVRARHAVAFHSNPSKRVAMVHLSLHPNSSREVHWNNEVEPTRIWLDRSTLPAGVQLDEHLLTAELPPKETSSEARRFSFEVTLPEDVDAVTVKGYALFHICEGVDGTCIYRRLDLEIPVARR